LPGLGWRDWGNIRANGHPSGGRWRQLRCIVCRGYFLETLGTLFHGKRVAPELLVRVITCLAEGIGLRGTARGFEVDPNTVLHWLVDAAQPLHAFSAYFLHDLSIHQVQLDELYAVLSAVKAGEVSTDEAIEHLSRSPHWVWTTTRPYGEETGVSEAYALPPGAKPVNTVLFGVKTLPLDVPLPLCTHRCRALYSCLRTSNMCGTSDASGT
jgi:hypothetical protein